VTLTFKIETHNIALSDVDEFNHLNLTGGDDTIAYDDLFVLAEEEEELNVFDGSATDLIM
jgi:hypothetical protein